MDPARALAGVRVAATGSRIAVRACAELLRSLGAAVSDRPEGGEDVLLRSSDVDGPPAGRAAAQVACDITAYGSSGPLAGRPDPDSLVQATVGFADTTGEADGPPVVGGFAATEGLGALCAAVGVIAALQARARTGEGQDVEIALYDCAFTTLASFVPFPLCGLPVTRAGNRHVASAPWNVYPASDGPLVICTATEEQWTRLCSLIGREDLAADPALGRPPGRVAQSARIDQAIGEWSARLGAVQAAAKLEALGIPAGPIVAARDLASEANLAHRALVRPRAGGYSLPSAIRCFPPVAMAAGRVPSPSGGDLRPFAGLRVLDMGTFTTAPLAARHLGALGAEVIKIESPAGDNSRAWKPGREHSYYFSLSNSDKQSLRLDLREARDLRCFRDLVASADVLVENLKPGSLARLGFSPEALAGINPGLVYCAISGFGADSAYPGRPAFDTVIQAMSGMMDLTRSGGVPQKLGVSLADMMGGLFGLLGVSAALHARMRTGTGAHLDIAMQDAAAWITQWRPLPGEEGRVSRDAAGRYQVEAAGRAAPVLGMAEVLASGQTRARALVQEAPDGAGRAWPVFGSPFGLRGTPPRVSRAIGALGEANAWISS